jgi:acylphosphatase
MSERLTRRLLIRGRVQGVWFREAMRMQAERLGVTGWVRNRMDGSVEAVVQGSAEAVEAMTRWAQRGPEAAQVKNVEVSSAEGDYARFDKRPTG